MYEERASSSPYIQFVWRATAKESGSFVDLAHDFWVLVFRTGGEQTEVLLTGPVTQPEPIYYRAGQTNWGIVLKAHVFVRGLAKKDTLNARTPLPMANDGSFMLRGHQLSMPTYETAEAFVGELVKHDILVASPVIAKALDGAPPAMSTRHLQRHYATATGLTQRQLQQIQRARHAFVLLTQGESIAKAATDAGYADQAHMTRSLKLLAGQTPGQIIKDYLSLTIVAPVQ
jgi:hypothetical protein